MEDGNDEEDGGVENSGAARKGNGDPYEDVSKEVSGADADRLGRELEADEAGGAMGTRTGPGVNEPVVGWTGLMSDALIGGSGNSVARAPGPVAGGGGPGGGAAADRQRGGRRPDVTAGPPAPAAARSSFLA